MQLRLPFSVASDGRTFDRSDLVFGVSHMELHYGGGKGHTILQGREGGGAAASKARKVALRDPDELAALLDRVRKKKARRRIPSRRQSASCRAIPSIIPSIACLPERVQMNRAHAVNESSLMWSPDRIRLWYRARSGL
jgi:hypothetical protein